MRDAMGSAWIFSICLTFIILFTAYLTISLNYAKAFRVKNYIVSYIEEHEGYDQSFNQDLENYLLSEGYNTYGKCEARLPSDGYEEEWILIDESCIGDAPAGNCAICVYNRPSPVENEDICASRSNYRVVAFFKFDIPVVRYYTSFQVGGETRYFYDFASYGRC